MVGDSCHLVDEDYSASVSHERYESCFADRTVSKVDPCLDDPRSD